MFLSKCASLSDIHCHLIPYVDDGAGDIYDAKALLLEEYTQGVRQIVMTPHFRYRMFDTSIEIVNKHYEELKKWISQNDMDDLQMHLSREYYCDERFEIILKAFAEDKDSVSYDGREYIPSKELIPFGKSRCILIEFSPMKVEEDEMKNIVNNVLDAGLTPVIAHFERYQNLASEFFAIRQIKELGAYIQVNADSLISKNHRSRYIFAKHLLNEDLIDFASSDAHDLTTRAPRLNKCYSYLKRKTGKRKADELMYQNAYDLINGNLQVLPDTAS